MLAMAVVAAGRLGPMLRLASFRPCSCWAKTCGAAKCSISSFSTPPNAGRPPFARSLCSSALSRTDRNSATSTIWSSVSTGAPGAGSCGRRSPTRRNPGRLGNGFTVARLKRNQSIIALDCTPEVRQVIWHSP